MPPIVAWSNALISVAPGGVTCQLPVIDGEFLPRKIQPPTRFEDKAGDAVQLRNLKFAMHNETGPELGLSRFALHLGDKTIGQLRISDDYVALLLLFAASPTLLALAKRAHDFLADGGTKAEATDLRYDLYWALWGQPDAPRECIRHPGTRTMLCGDDECRQRYLCLGSEPHHLDDEANVGIAPWLPEVNRNLTEQVTKWFETHAELPRFRKFPCPVCFHLTHARWRGAGDAIKITCFGCGIQVDVARPTNARRSS